jgi:hypothetical protein
VVGLAYDEPRGALYVSDIDNQVIRRIDVASGIIDTLAHFPDGCPPWGCFAGALFPVLDGDSLYINDDGNHVVIRYDLSVSPPSVEIYAGQPLHLAFGFNGDRHPATEAYLAMPEGLAIDSAGKLFIADTYTARVRRVGGVDILPRTYPNVIGRSGVIEVAVLATHDFSPTELDPSTLGVGAAPIELLGNGRPRVRYEDVDSDGRPDLVFRVLAATSGSRPATARRRWWA